MDEKRFFLEQMIKDYDESKLLVFVRTKVRAERVVKAMNRVNISTESLHGDIPQKQRFQILERFKNGENKVLVTTDVSARGIDIPNVDLVINYDISEPAENYIHRVGRTGRGQNRGTAISFCSDEEKIVLQQVEERLGLPIQVITIDRGTKQDVLDLSNERNTDWQTLLKTEEQRRSKKRRKK